MTTCTLHTSFKCNKETLFLRYHTMLWKLWHSWFLLAVIHEQKINSTTYLLSSASWRFFSFCLLSANLSSRCLTMCSVIVISHCWNNSVSEPLEETWKEISREKQCKTCTLLYVEPPTLKLPISQNYYMYMYVSDLLLTGLEYANWVLSEYFWLNAIVEAIDM